MAANVLFKKLTRAQFDALLSKDNGTLYRVTETDLTESFYQGSNKLNNQAEIDAAIAALTGSATIASVDAGVVTLKAGIAEASGIVSNSTGADITLAKVATTGAAEDVSYDNTTSGLTASDVQNAIDELAEASAGGVDSKTIWINPNEGVTTGYLKTYGIYQGANSYDAQTNPATLIGKIDIPKDLVVTSGSVGTVVVADEPYEGAVVGDKYIDLAIANQTEHIYIPASSLVDIYTPQANATQVQLAIDSNNVISATIVAGSVGTTELAGSAVTHAKLATDAVEAGNIKDGEVTKVKLASGVQASLDLADSAVQSITEGATNGTIDVDGTEVAVHGLGTAAFTAATAYDPAGSATTSENNAKAYADGLLTWEEVE